MNIHIPKTAGTTLRVQMSRHTQILGADLLGSFDNYYQALRQAAIARLPELRKEGIQFMSGHYRYRDIRDVLESEKCDISLITFVRDPIMRTLSDYFYCISSRHNAQKQFIAEYPTLEHYLNNRGQMNKQFQYLCMAENDSVEMVFENLQTHFDFVGVTERFETHCEWFLSQLGLKKESSVRENTNLNREAMQEAYLQHQDQMRDALDKDMALYQMILNAWDQHKRA